MPSKPYMPLYTKDYLQDTSRLTTEEHGAYFLLIMDYWTQEKPIPDNIKILSSITKLAPKRIQKVIRNLFPFFTIKDGFLVHERIEKELKEYYEKASKRASKASHAAKSRWDDVCSEQCSEHAPSNAPAMPYTNTNTNTNTNFKYKPTKKPTKKPPAPPSPVISEIFNFWKITMNHPKAILDKKRSSAISGALKNHDPEIIKKAILGCSMDPWHMGVENGGRVHDKIPMILRDADHVEKFCGYVDRPPAQKYNNQKSKAVLRSEANDEVLDRWLKKESNLEGEIYEG